MNGRQLRIGELSRRLELSAELLRAWERRYGIPQPRRTQGGLRLYSEEDERRLREMQAQIAAGMSPAEAAALVKSTGVSPARAAGAPPSALVRELERSLDRFDDAGAQRTLDRLFAGFTLEAAIEDVVLPYLRRLGERWRRAEVSVAQEHFASNLVRARVLAVGRGWDAGAGPHALLACPPGELHDLALACFGLLLRGHGWRITYFGQDTPAATLLDATQRLGPNVVVLAAVTAERFSAMEQELERLGQLTRLVLAGRAARFSAHLPGEAIEAGPAELGRLLAAPRA